MHKQIIYYTCLTHDDDIEQMCRKQLLKANVPIVSVSRSAPIDFGENFVVDRERSAITMHYQVLKGLQEATAKYVYLCESDVLYHPSHFNFSPPRDDTFYYNINVWKWWPTDGKCVWTDDMQQVSGICANRELLLDFYTERLKQIESEGFNRHFEPGHHQSVGSKLTATWLSQFPNICIRHENTLTKSKRSPDEFRNKQYAKGWKETTLDQIQGWDDLKI